MSECALYRLMSWLSPAFPVGAFSHSGGLEWAVGENLVTTREALLFWIEDALWHGIGRNDAVLFVHAHRAVGHRDHERLLNAAELAAALHPSHERRFEAIAQGAAFRRIARATAPCAGLEMLNALDDESLSYPIVVAALAAGHGIGLPPALTAYLHASVSNLVSAAQRLIPLGQTDGQIAIATLESSVTRLAAWAAALPDGDPMDALGSATLLADFASLAHETQYTRLFRT